MNNIKKYKKIDKTLYFLNKLVIDENNFDKAVEFGKALKEKLKQAEKIKKELEKPYKEELKKIKQEYEDYVKPISSAVEKLRNKVVAYQYEQQRKKEEEERKRLIEETKKLAKKTAEEIIKEKKQEQAITIKHSPKMKLRTRKIWTFEIIDETKIPREFMMPNLTKIREVIKTGKKIPGVKSWKDERSYL